MPNFLFTTHVFFQVQFNQGSAHHVCVLLMWTIRFGPMFFRNCFIEHLTGCINFPSKTWESIIMSLLNRIETQHSSERLTHSMECEQNIMNRSYVCFQFEAIVHFIKRCVSQITRLIWLAAVLLILAVFIDKQLLVALKTLQLIFRRRWKQQPLIWFRFSTNSAFNYAHRIWMIQKEKLPYADWPMTTDHETK